MTAFRFRLEKVLQLRRMQLEVEEAKFAQRRLEVQQLEARQAEIEQAKSREETAVRQGQALTGGDLAALARFREYLANQEQLLAQRKEEARQRAEAQQKAMVEARRRCELLERLKQTRRAEWQTAADQELEQLAAESYLANAARRGK